MRQGEEASRGLPFSMVSNKGTAVGGQERLSKEAAHSGHGIITGPAGSAAKITSGGT